MKNTMGKEELKERLIKDARSRDIANYSFEELIEELEWRYKKIKNISRKIK